MKVSSVLRQKWTLPQTNTDTSVPAGVELHMVSYFSTQQRKRGGFMQNWGM